MNNNRKRTQLCISTAQKFLEAYEAQRGSLTPPIPVIDLASSLGFQVVYLSLVEDEFSALVSTREKLIGINNRHHRRRQRFSICHELAHILLNHPPEARCSRKEIDLYNTEADECAAEILMPSNLLKQWLQQTQSISELARTFDVSEEAMTRKLMNLGLFGQLVRETQQGWNVEG